jgi:hypothetical protein
LQKLQKLEVFFDGRRNVGLLHLIPGVIPVMTQQGHNSERQVSTHSSKNADAPPLNVQVCPLNLIVSASVFAEAPRTQFSTADLDGNKLVKLVSTVHQ